MMKGWTWRRTFLGGEGRVNGESWERRQAEGGVWGDVEEFYRKMEEGGDRELLGRSEEQARREAARRLDVLAGKVL